MFPFWEVAVAPVLEAAGARRLVEIGALRGENTRQIIERLGPRTVLHVIDPLPDFDPVEHEKEFGGQYVFHRALSLDVLGDLPPMDAALVDGDHNWYTVVNELRLLGEVARAHDAPLPVLLLHDVGWPYGRRDLYYDPSNIPDEYRREWQRAGMEPGKVRLLPFGKGLNPTLANAKAEGGRRNGVMTALEDFVAVHDRPMRVVVLPIYFGLAIAVEVERLERQPSLAAELDRLESAAGKHELLELAESIRLDALIFQHRIFYDREASVARVARRYLGQVREGPVGDDAGRVLLADLEHRMDVLRGAYVRGDLVVLGGDGVGSVLFLAAYVTAHDLVDRRVWAMAAGRGDDVRAGLERLDLPAERTVVVDTAFAAEPEVPEEVALVVVGAGCDERSAPLLARTLTRLGHGAQVHVELGAEAWVAGAVTAAAGELGLVEVDAPEARAWRRAGEPAPAVAPTPAEPSLRP